jgi:hypothetical protein
MPDIKAPQGPDSSPQAMAWRGRSLPGRRRNSEPLATAAFAGGSAAVFIVLAGCVMAAVVFYYQSH